MNKVSQPDSFNIDDQFKKFIAKDPKDKQGYVRKIIKQNNRLKKQCQRLYMALLGFQNIAFSRSLGGVQASMSQTGGKTPGMSYIDEKIKKIQGLLKLSKEAHQFSKSDRPRLTSSTGLPKKSIAQSIASTNTSQQGGRLKQNDDSQLIIYPKNISFSQTITKNQTISIEEYQNVSVQLFNANQQKKKLQNQMFQLSSKAGKLQKKLKTLSKKLKQTKNDLYILRTNLISDVRKQIKQVTKLMQKQHNSKFQQLSNMLLKVNTQIMCNNQRQNQNLIQNIHQQIQNLKNDSVCINILQKQKYMANNEFVNEILKIIYYKTNQQIKQFLIQLIKTATIDKNQLNLSINLSRKKSKKQPQLKQRPSQQLKQMLFQKISQLKKQIQQNEVLSGRELIIKYPKLSFMVSNILPILGLNSKNKDEKINEVQEFILSSITDYYKSGKKICGFRLLFSYKLHNRKVNFHQFVDDHPNLLLIIKLKKCQSVVGVYSERGLIQSSVVSQQNKNNGFIFDSLSKKVYKPRQKYSENDVMPYQEYYIEAGHQDIKIRFDSQQIESCFGSQMSMFRPNSSYTVDSLLHNGSEEITTLTDYQFYQVLLI